MPVKQSIKSQLFDRLNEALARGRHNLTAFEIKGFERDAKALLKVDTIQGYIAMGSVSSLKMDVDESIRWHELALKSAPTSFEAIFNYAASMAGLGKFSVARNLTNRLLEPLKSEPATLSQTGHNFLLSTGQINKALKYCSSHMTEPLINVLTSSQLSDEEIEPYFDALESIIIKSKVSVSLVDLIVDEDDECIYLTQYVSASPEQAGSLSMELAEALSCLELSSKAVRHFTVTLNAA